MARRATRWGALWELEEESKSFYRLKATKFDVRDIAEAQALVILGQDGVSGEDYEEDAEPLDEKQAQIVGEASKLLKFRWREGWLMDLIVNNPEFAKGNFKECIAAAYNMVDEEVGAFVEKNLDKTHVQWDHPLLWRALFNSFVVIVTPEAVYTAGGGSFCIRTISSSTGKLVPPDPDYLENFRVTTVKTKLAYGSFPKGTTLKMVDKLTLDDTCWKCELAKGDRLVVEQMSSVIGTGRWWDEHAGDWEAAMKEERSCFLQALLLEVEYPVKSPVTKALGLCPAPVPLSPRSPNVVSPTEVRERPCKKRRESMAMPSPPCCRAIVV